MLDSRPSAVLDPAEGAVRRESQRRQDSTYDGSSPEEKDLIKMFLCYSELCSGLFPDLLDWPSLDGMVRWLQFTSDSSGKPQMPRAKRAQEWSEAQTKLQRGLKFAVELPPEADSHYAGRGVSLGAADTPIFWCRPKDSKKYRMIYADLSVRDADTPPSLPDAQPVPAPSSPKQ